MEKKISSRPSSPLRSLSLYFCHRILFFNIYFRIHVLIRSCYINVAAFPFQEAPRAESAQIEALTSRAKMVRALAATRRANTQGLGGDQDRAPSFTRLSRESADHVLEAVYLTTYATQKTGLQQGEAAGAGAGAGALNAGVDAAGRMLEVVIDGSGRPPVSQGNSDSYSPIQRMLEEAQLRRGVTPDAGLGLVGGMKGTARVTGRAGGAAPSRPRG